MVAGAKAKRAGRLTRPDEDWPKAMAVTRAGTVPRDAIRERRLQNLSMIGKAGVGGAAAERVHEEARLPVAAVRGT